MVTTDLNRELLNLTEEPDGGPCISLYAPMEMGCDAAQNPTRVENLLREAQRTLVSREFNRDRLRQWLQPLQNLLHERPFWEHQQPGFAAFLSPHQFQHFTLPFKVPEQVIVGDRFHLKPLLPILTDFDRFYLLALSQHSLRLFECTPGHCQAIPLPQGVPESLEQSNRFEDAGGSGPRQMTDHRQARNSGFGVSGSPHGIGVKNEELEEYRKRFLRQVNEGLKSFWHGQSVPVMLAGVDDLVQSFRKELTYASVLPEHVSGNLDQARPNELLEKAWPIADRHFRQVENEAVAGYAPALANQLASSALEQVLPAALDGRIATLFVARGQNVWGQVSPEGRQPELLPADHPMAHDLLDLAAMKTLHKGGQVYALQSPQMPDSASPVAAIFRY